MILSATDRPRQGYPSHIVVLKCGAENGGRMAIHDTTLKETRPE